MDKLLYIIKRLIPVKLFKVVQPVYHFVLNWIAALVYGNPSNKLIVIGVTGTTGKTTSSYLIMKMLQNAGYKVGMTSTAIFHDGEKEWMNDKKMTMVGRFFTQKMLRTMLLNKCQYAIIETTSEGVVQYRHRFINYDTLVFTGLYPEHIESHGSFEKYREAKGELFKHLKKCKTKYRNDRKEICPATEGLKKIDLERVKKTTILNGDDDNFEYFFNFFAEKKIVYSKNDKFNLTEGDNVRLIKYSDILIKKNGLYFKALDTEFNTKLLGEFNATNAMNAICVGISEKIEAKKIKGGIEGVSGVAGRLEKIEEGQKFIVIVDYAFEPNAVKKLYETVTSIPTVENRKIIHVLGSTGGGRDVSRRPILGKIAGEGADYVIVTNEDPYDDDPDIIIDQVALGAENAGKKIEKDLFKIKDRSEAIKKALILANIGDIVLITGKGNEQAICTANGEKIPWDDRTVTRDLLKKSFKNT